MKQVVTKSCRYEPVFTQPLQQWAMHYNLTLLTTQVAKPKDKSAVENEVKIAYQRIYAPLRDDVFLNIGIVRDAQWNFYISDQGNNRIRKMSPYTH
jgi:transposase